MPKIIAPKFIVKDNRFVTSSTDMSIEVFDKILKDSRNLVKVLVTRFVGLGDVLLVLPALKAFKQKYKNLGLNVEIDFQTSKKFINLVSRFDFIDEVVAIPDKAYTFTINLQDKVDYLPVCDKDHRLNLFSDLLCTNAFLDTNFKFITTTQDTIKGNSILKNIGIDRNKPIVAVAPISYALIRSWMRFRELPSVLPGTQFVLIHSTKLTNVTNYYDLSAQLQVNDLPGVLMNCDAVISVDNGILHLAGMLERPLIALFGPIDPDYRVRYYANKAVIWNRHICNTIPCWDHQIRICTKDKNQSSACLDSISPKQIIQRLGGICYDARIPFIKDS